MEQTNNETVETKEQEVEEISLEEGCLPENILRGLIQTYQSAWNKNNEKNEIKYYLTLTKHKIPTPDGNKDVAYLRLERAVREKVRTVVKEDGTSDDINPPEWSSQLVHTEMHVFTSMAQQVNPAEPWKPQLFWNMIGRLMSAGLEYAELLQKLKKTELNTLREQEEAKREIKEPKIMLATEMPQPLTPAEQEYANEIKELRKKKD